MKRYSIITTILLLFASSAVSDILVEVNATMITPVCDIRSENNSSPLVIDFGTVNSDNLDGNTVDREFPIYISGCDFNKKLAITLNTNGSNTLMHNGQLLLATTIEGLGIHFKEITQGVVRPFDVNSVQAIHPVQITATEYRADLQAQLVGTIPAEQLSDGQFTSSMTILMTYE
ncbi:type 1 fimbrial protein [Providencia stuartii]|uniref:Type 1 fimbrial protein n=1 Tax=Providencia stuartii TaxID=588 RepID=A0AAI9DDW7_PROST|nr:MULTISPECIES: fimbrial protein [Providencia]MDV5227078.1 fimbrial protein [Providencia rettgeri]ELR5039979.1 type 1 fimbrial protein [Providencia stuartii]ELR5082197.1 type 1 fimbrial protein [Providencia stuartii]ELR5113781.1 type 1 fimbrial protein [Providencia stuartii]ELR5301100.1 type 1 fimbrial protein [Providencia stuartii]